MSEHDQFLGDPIVIDPPDFDIKAAWGECSSYVDGTEAAAMVAQLDEADPGITSCPSCKASYWAWGQKQRCKACGFEFPTDWWPMYSYGCRWATGPRWLRESATCRRTHAERMAHPYYRYGVEHPADEPWEAKDTIDWKAVMEAPK